jgi:hypothetical protein
VIEGVKLARIILGGLLALMIISGVGLCDVAKMPASADLYVNLKDLVTYNSDALRCDTGMGNVTNFTAIQFDISGVDLSDSDIVLLTLKATSDDRSTDASGNISVNTTPENASSGISGLVAMPISSSWSEFSGTDSFLASLLPGIESLLVHGIDLHQMGICLSDGGARSFDVTRDVRDARARGDDGISFLIGAFGNGEYRAEFLSRETGQGPYLLIFSYPQEDQSSSKEEAVRGGAPDSSNQSMPTPFSVRMKESAIASGQERSQAENSTSIAAIRQRDVQKSLDFMAAKVSDSMPSTSDVQPASPSNDTLQIGLDL